MKKAAIFILALFLAAVLLCLLCGCGWNKSTANTNGSDGRMMCVYNDGFVLIYVDTSTGVQYITRADAGTCVMVDLDGKPVPFPGFDAKEDRP